MKRRWLLVACAVAAGLAAAVPVAYTTHLRNFRAVRPGVLYRSGQLTPAGLALVLRAYRIRTVVTLRTVRDPGRPYPDAWEAEACAARGVRHVRLRPRLWVPDQTGEPPARETVREFLAVLDDPANHPVLVHCFAGIHRTGTLAAVFRREYDRWDADDAVAEMDRGGYGPGPMRRDVEAFLLAYQPRGQSGCGAK